MKKQIVIFLLALAVAIPALAGGERCDGSKEEVVAMKTKLIRRFGSERRLLVWDILNMSLIILVVAAQVILVLVAKQCAQVGFLQLRSDLHQLPDVGREHHHLVSTVALLQQVPDNAHSHVCPAELAHILRLRQRFKLRVIKLDGNRLFGYHAPVFWYLPHLEVVNITGNLFDREIAMELHYCANLTYVGLGDNQFTGTIPSELGLLTALKQLDLSGNAQIHGTIPTEVLSMTSLTLLDVTKTSVDGSLPPSLCQKEDEDKHLKIKANCSLVQCCS